MVTYAQTYVLLVCPGIELCIIAVEDGHSHLLATMVR